MLNPNEERLQKALARAGIASRRASEELIAAGRVSVNGKVITELGTKIDPTRDRVTVDGAPVSVRPGSAPQKIYLMLNKPSGYLSTVSDPQGRPTIMNLIDSKKGERLFPVGRLDMDSEGLLLLTNDGAFANAVSHPKFGVEKEYLATLDGIVAMKDLEKLRRGVAIEVEDPETGEVIMHQTRPAKIELVRHEGSNSLVRFILKEGKKRQIRLMAEVIEHPVVDLTRVRFGPLKLGDLHTGKFRALSKAEVHSLLEAAQEQTEAKPGPKVAPGANRAERPLPASPAAPESTGPSAPRRPLPPPFRPPAQDRKPSRWRRSGPGAPVSPGSGPSGRQARPGGPRKSGPGNPARTGPRPAGPGGPPPAGPNRGRRGGKSPG